MYVVSFHTSLSPTRTMIQEIEDPSKKRKWEALLRPEEIPDQSPSSRAKYTASVFDTELHLETPLPLEWQRCLDIKSGQIYYFNTRTNKKTSRDPRNGSQEQPSSPEKMSLDLELNLPCGSSETARKNHGGDHHNLSKYKSSSTTSNRNGSGDAVSRGPSWLALEGGGEQLPPPQPQQQEMVTAVCKRCHMLVMMFKSSPSCPNCKFMHPPDQAPPSLFNRGLSLLC